MISGCESEKLVMAFILATDWNDPGYGCPLISVLLKGSGYEKLIERIFHCWHQAC